MLAHELAHIRRCDYAVNLAQTAIETLFFYHPAVWWVSRQIRIEREHCCDDVAIAACGGRLLYASALVQLEETRGALPQMAVAAGGASLKSRVRRILYSTENKGSAWPAGALVLILATLFLWDAPRIVAQDSRLPANYKKWLTEDVAYIITDSERAAFRALSTNQERDHFIEQFWLRRDPTRGTPANEYKDEHYRRIAWVNDRFQDGALPGWTTDRGRVYIVYGPPDEIESHHIQDYEEWLYHHIEGVGDEVVIKFVDGHEVMR